MADLFGSAPQGASRRRSSITGATASTRKSMAPSNVFRIPSNIDVSLGLQWEFIGDDPVDLDASCVAFDDQGCCIEAVFFNNMKTEKEYIIHTGDNTTGEDDGDDDESIVFHMGKVPKQVHYMMVCVTSYTGANFQLVESAHVRLVNLATKEVVGQFSLGVVGHHTASLLCAFSRVSPHPDEAGLYWWDMRELNMPCSGYTFCDLLPNMLKVLAVPPSDYEAKLAKLPDYSLEKIADTENMVLSQLKFGLGWDGENDLDASLVMVDAQGRYVDHVYAKFGKLRSHVAGPTASELMARVTAGNLAIAARGGAIAPLEGPEAEIKSTATGTERKAAVVHSGDKLNGFDVEGDDEFIEVDLMNVHKDVAVIYFIAQLHDGFAKTLSEVPRGYVRMLNKSSVMDKMHKEMDRIGLRDVDDTATSFIPYAVVKKDAAHWELVHVRQSEEGRDWVDVFPFLRVLTRLHVDLDAWKCWRQDVYPFAINVEIHGVRELGPLEPHQFACHCWAWICDKKWTPTARFRTCVKNDRSDLNWENERHTFVVTKKDVLRLMVFETAVVGYSDVVLADFFRQESAPEDIGGPPPRMLSPPTSLVPAPSTTTAQSNNGGGHMTVSDVEMEAHDGNGTSDAGGGTGGAGGKKSRRSPPNAMNAGAVTQNPLSASSSGAAALPSPTKSPIHRTVLMVKEGDLLLDRVWLPLSGVDVTGEICVSVRRVDLPRRPDEDPNRKGWCVAS